MNLRAQINRRAAELGFDRVAVCEARAFERWHAESGDNPHCAGLKADPRAWDERAQSILVLARGYHPFGERPGEANLNAYYANSTAVRKAAGALAEELRARGVEALAQAAFPYKASAARSGLGQYGRNGLIGAPGLGSRLGLQCVLLRAPLEPDAPLPGEFSPECARCSACVRACPASALRGDGRVDMNRCLRALPEREPLPEWARPLMGLSVLGCDCCQRGCPRNRGIGLVEAPRALTEALEISRLLVGNVSLLAPMIGPNYARKKRVQARACIIAANARRKDLLPLVEALREDDFPAVREHARWAGAVLAAL